MKNYYILIVFFLFLLPNLYGQEVCNNGIDDDNNGLIDCFDPACSNSTDCEDFFYGGSDPSCQFIPTAGSFELEEIWNTRSANGGTIGNSSDVGSAPLDQRATVMAGDIDGDGTPDVVAKRDDPGKLYVFSGVDGSIKYTADVNSSSEFTSVAIGDVDGDGLGEIFFVDNNARLNRYDYMGGGLVKTYTSTNTFQDKVATPELADFNGDGNIEVYVGTHVFSANDGTRLVSGLDYTTASVGGHIPDAFLSGGYEPFSVAVDVFQSTDIPPRNSCLDCNGLEIVAGNAVYTINLGDGTEDNGNLTEVSKLDADDTPDGDFKEHDGVTSIADMDNDGDIDAVVASNGFIYIWDLQTESKLHIGLFDLNNDVTNGSTVGNTGSTTTTAGGVPNIADFDNDNQLEAGLAGKGFYVVVQLDGIGNPIDELWSRNTDDNGNDMIDDSQRTTSAVFDFEGDGINEVVYSEEVHLFVLRGTDGTILSEIDSPSGTRFDNPLVVDVNGDGQTEIVATAQDIPAPANSGTDYIRAFRSKNQPWVPSRQVWNQHNYFITNVNDDLSIPRIQQDITVSPPNRVINNSLTQASFYSSNANYLFASPNMEVEFVGSNTFCQDASNDITLSFKITNTGDATLPAGVPISIFSTNPYTNIVGDADLIATFNTPSEVAANGTPLNFSETISPSGSLSEIFILLNHDHEGAKALKMMTSYQLDSGNPATNQDREVISGIGECNFDDNFFTFTAVGTTPNTALSVDAPQSTICSGQSTVIQVLNSESGINYQLRDASDNNVGNPVAGNGGTIELNSGNLTANTTFTVWATPTGTSCSLALTDTQVITVQSAPNLSLALETTNNNLCTGSDATVTIKNAENGISYQASLGGNVVGTAATGTGVDLDLTIPAASLSVGANNVMITATNPSICTLNLSNTLTINVANPPSSDRQFDTQVCVDSGQPASISIADSELGVSYQLRNNADNSAVGTAVAGTGESITLSSDPLTAATTFNILATGTAACNQSVSLNAIIEASINELSLSVAASQDTIFGGEEATIIATSGATNYTWTTRVERTNLPQDESIISGNNTSTINVAPVEDTWYIVTASDDKACSRTDSVLVAVRFEIFIPSLFSPNSDGNNDAFTIKTQSNSIQDLDFRVFDRAGNLVYETQDAVEATTTGWDGKNNGREQPISNYIWVIDGTFLNGQPIEYQGKNRGEINLIR